MTGPASTVLAGDRALLERVLAETGARTELPDPSWSDYLQSAAEKLVAWFADRLQPLGTLLHLSPEILRGVAWLILAGAAAGTILMFVRLATRRRYSAVHAPETRAEPLLPPLPADSWAEELERRLTAGDPRAALEALWWWLARRLIEQGGAAASLAGTDSLSSWTTRELLARARRGDLGALGRALDRQLYGATEPALHDVRALAMRLRTAL